MIKNLVLKIECLSCGTIFDFKREIVIDEFITNIKIVKAKCSCSSKKNKLLNIEL